MPDAEPVIDVDAMDAGPVPTPEGPPPITEPPGPEPARLPSRRERVRKIVAIAFITTVLLGAGVVTLTRSPFFDARSIEVRGTSHVARAEVLRIAATTPETNVFTFDTGAAEVRLERDPWIARATVTKDLPSGLLIDIRERFPVAVAESGGLLRLVADDGALLDAALPRMAVGLPVIASIEEGLEPEPEAVRGAARAIAEMAPTLRHRIDGVSILTDGQLRVDLSSGADVAYGEAVDLPEKAMALRALIDYAAGRGASVISADVRVPSAPTAVLAGGDVIAP
jgi:cell division protein FtsQ